MKSRSATFIGLALLTLVSALLWFQPANTSPRTNSLARDALKGSPTATRTSGVYALDQQSSWQPVATTATQRVSMQEKTMAPAPFAFLGKIMEDGQPVVLLHRAGQVFKIRGTGAVSEDYEVDALLENLVVLRYVPLGTSQVIELALRNDNATQDAAPQD